MLSKENKEIIQQIGKYKYNQMKEQNLIPSQYLKYLQLKQKEKALRKTLGQYKFRKMKQLGLSYEEFLQYEKDKEEEKKLKDKIGYADFNKMKELGFSYEEYKQFQKEQKLKKYEKKREKDKVRFKTIRYVERYCDLKMKCQICNTNKDLEIHHPNYNDYLKINLLCKKHHNQLHNFELVPPEIIDLEKNSKKPPQQEKQEQIKMQTENMKIDILENNYTYNDLSNKYKIESSTIKRYLQKQMDWKMLEQKLKENRKRKSVIKANSNKNNPLIEYKKKYNLTSKEISEVTGISLPTIRAIETGKTKIENITERTKQKLNILNKTQLDTK